MTDDSTPGKRGWAEHPVYIAGISVAGTLAICIAAYKEVLLPAQMARSEFEILALNQNLEVLKANSAKAAQTAEKSKSNDTVEIKKLSSELELIKDELKKLNIEFAGFKLGNIFFESGAYPASLDGVKVGQPAEFIEKKFKGLPTEKKDGYTTVKVNHPLFDSVVFYYSDEAPFLIYQIMYSVSYTAEAEVGSGYLHSQLERNFGEPVKIADDMFFWAVKDGVTMFKDSAGFIVSEGNSYPGGWDRALRRYLESPSAKKNNSK
ncbi:hypothetical protein [Pseudomonas fragi]|uniref:hypothetical protein n=1 Tax=Pseudomonas fragi TaxID=296 RepID=UPI00147358CC|nr:hypothetical protein [Pseudomonas fragi]NNB16042.1 hypothetical protein [Pseudomonas fragi]NNB21384.1 hypothetical protein [Pseudomonas fragi]